jgi:hypothetical protein
MVSSAIASPATGPYAGTAYAAGREAEAIASTVALFPLAKRKYADDPARVVAAAAAAP